MNNIRSLYMPHQPNQQVPRCVRALHLPHQPNRQIPRWDTTYWLEAQAGDPALNWMIRIMTHNLHAPEGKFIQPCAQESILFGPYAQWLQRNYQDLGFNRAGILCYIEKIKTTSSSGTPPHTPEVEYLKLVASKDQVPALIRAHESAAHTSARNCVHYCEYIYFKFIYFLLVVVHFKIPERQRCCI